MDRDEPFLSLVPRWEHDGDEELARTPIFTLRRRRAQSPTQPSSAGEFVYLDSPDWVNVIALTAAREVVLIEQYRHGIDRVTLEIPGGMVEPDEEPLATGIRELREETGYAGEAATVIGAVTPNPAIMNNVCHTVLITDVRPVAGQDLEMHEEIGLRRVPLEGIPDLMRDGLIHHALVVAAFHHLGLRNPG